MEVGGLRTKNIIKNSTNGKILISIITVVYNGEETLEKTIKSVINQNYENVEYIIIDGASSDSTLKIVKKYEDKIDYWQSEPDKGIYDAMNKGIEKATGDIIGILNADDCYSNTLVLSHIVEAFEKFNTDAVYGNILYVKNSKIYRYWKSGNVKSFYFGWMPPHPSLFVKKSVYNNFGLFRLDCGINADYELMLRIFEINRISATWINEVTTYMEAGGTSNNGIKSRIAGIKNDNISWIKNGIKPKWYTLFLKKIRKIPQFLTIRKGVQNTWI